MHSPFDIHFHVTHLRREVTRYLACEFLREGNQQYTAILSQGQSINHTALKNTKQCRSKTMLYLILLCFCIVSGCDHIMNEGTKMFVHDLDRSQLSCVPLRPAPDPNMRWLSCEVSVKQIDNSVIKTGTVQLWMKEMNQMDGNESYTILPLVFPNSRTITYQVSERKIQIILSNFQDHEIPDFKLVIFKRIRFQ